MNIRRIVFNVANLFLILHGLSVNTYASNLVEDRYEIIKDTNINIEDNYDIGEKDISIEGNTIFNLADEHYGYYNNVSTNGEMTATRINNGLRLNFNNQNLYNENIIIYMGTNIVKKLQPSTDYTIQFEVKTNMEYSNWISIRGADWSNPVTDTVPITFKNGVNKVLIRTSDNLLSVPDVNQMVYLSIPNTNTLGNKYIEISNMMVLTGDYTEENINYISGIKSVGEKDDGIHALQLKNTYNNEDGTNEYTNKINLVEPLRSLPNGIKDKIIKKDGQWVIERNIEQIILNGSENWYLDWERSTGSTNYFRCNTYNRNELLPDYYNRTDNFFLNNRYRQSKADDNWNPSNNKVGLDINIYGEISMRYSKITLDEFKNEVINNPIKLIRQLPNPIYEPITSSIVLYMGANNISSDSIVPANIEVVIDRICNIANHYIEIAKMDSTVNNISVARMWVNQINDSLIKDNFQEELNMILNLKDLIIEKSSISNNSDIYIKLNNTLSLSMDINSIIFDDFTGVESLEKKNALNLTVSTSLPYEINVYLEGGIYNSDKSQNIDKRVLSLKENNQNDYKEFYNQDKIKIVENHPSGKNIVHRLDIRLNGGIINKSDIYKTTLKFEVKQI